jgi:hypothetical protein
VITGPASPDGGGDKRCTAGMAPWCPGIPPYLGQFGAGGQGLRDTEAVRAGMRLSKPPIRHLKRELTTESIVMTT